MPLRLFARTFVLISLCLAISVVGPYLHAACGPRVLDFSTQLSPQAQLLYGIANASGKTHFTKLEWLRPMMERMLIRIYEGERDPIRVIGNEFENLPRGVAIGKLTHWLVEWIRQFVARSDEIAKMGKRYQVARNEFGTDPVEMQMDSLTRAELTATRKKDLSNFRFILARGRECGQRALETAVLVGDFGFERFDQYCQSIIYLKSNPETVDRWLQTIRKSRKIFQTMLTSSDRGRWLFGEIAAPSGASFNPLMRNFVARAVRSYLVRELQKKDPRRDATVVRQYLQQELSRLAAERIDLAFSVEAPNALEKSGVEWTNLAASEFGMPLAFNGLFDELSNPFELSMLKIQSASGLKAVAIGDRAFRRLFLIGEGESSPDALLFDPIRRRLVIGEAKAIGSLSKKDVAYALQQLSTGLEYVRAWTENEGLVADLEIAIRRGALRRPFDQDKDHYLTSVDSDDRVLVSGELAVLIREID